MLIVVKDLKIFSIDIKTQMNRIEASLIEIKGILKYGKPL
jgi:hypothetical protein